MLTELKEKVVFVTGSARRVGKMIALEFARQSANLIIHHSNSDDAAAETAEDIRALGVDALIVKGDHSQLADIQRNFDELMDHYGRLDVLVNSAGLFPMEDLLDITPEEWQRVLDVNLSAPFYCSQFAGRIMRDGEIAGSIINIGDTSAMRPWKARPHHSITKAGVVMLTEVSALALADHNIRVNCIVPGPVLRAENISEERWNTVVAGNLPLQRSGEPEDVARAAVFLATNDFITGATLRVDGGETLRDRPSSSAYDG